MTNSTNTGYNGDPLAVQLDPLPKTISIGSPFPNPFNNNVVFPVTTMESGFAEYSIFDVKGEKIKYEKNLVIYN